jgi:AcrR family transcriptional regulator
MFFRTLPYSHAGTTRQAEAADRRRLDRRSPGGVGRRRAGSGRGATKGSFYWHFADRDALIEAAVLRWEREHTEAVITFVDAEPDPLARLRLLIGAVLGSTTQQPEGNIELAMLATAAHPYVAPVLTRVTERRVAYTAGLFSALGWPPEQARRRGLLAVTAYLGHAQVAHVAPGTLPRTEADRRQYVDQVIRLLTAPEDAG